MRYGTVNYKKRNFTERHFSFCKREIGQIYFPNIQYINTTDDIVKLTLTQWRGTTWTAKTISSYESLPTRGNTVNYFNFTINAPSLTSKVNETTIAGVSIAGILSLPFVVFLVCLLKRRRFHCLQAEQQEAVRHHGSNKTTYDDLVVTSQIHDYNHTYDTLRQASKQVMNTCTKA